LLVYLAKLCRIVSQFASMNTAAMSRTLSSIVATHCPAILSRRRIPIGVVEVLSPSNATKDLRDKLVGYFQVPSIVHYLVVDPDDRFVIHHARGDGDAIAARILSAGSSLKLDQPGLEMAVGEFFPPP
jgi:Putative restriction endonuclease